VFTVDVNETDMCSLWMKRKRRVFNVDVNKTDMCSM